MFTLIDDFRESIGADDFAGIDPVYCVLEHVLQQARQTIETVTGYDFTNDYAGPGLAIYTYGNYMCSAYDWSEQAWEELAEQVKAHREVLAENAYCNYLFAELGIGAE